MTETTEEENEYFLGFAALAAVIFMLMLTVLGTSLLPSVVDAKVVNVTSSMDSNGTTWYNVTATYRTITAHVRVKCDEFFVNSTMWFEVTFGHFDGFAPQFGQACG